MAGFGPHWGKSKIQPLEWGGGSSRKETERPWIVLLLLCGYVVGWGGRVAWGRRSSGCAEFCVSFHDLRSHQKKRQSRPDHELAVQTMKTVLISPSQPVGLRCLPRLHHSLSITQSLCWLCSHFYEESPCRPWQSAVDRRLLLRVCVPSVHSTLLRKCAQASRDHLFRKFHLANLRTAVAWLQARCRCPPNRALPQAVVAASGVRASLWSIAFQSH